MERSKHLNDAETVFIISLLEERKDNTLAVSALKKFNELMEPTQYGLFLIPSRFAAFEDREISIISSALEDDENLWTGEEDREICSALADEANDEEMRRSTDKE